MKKKYIEIAIKVIFTKQTSQGQLSVQSIEI